MTMLLPSDCPSADDGLEVPGAPMWWAKVACLSADAGMAVLGETSGREGERAESGGIDEGKERAGPLGGVRALPVLSERCEGLKWPHLGQVYSGRRVRQHIETRRRWGMQRNGHSRASSHAVSLTSPLCAKHF
jgi:hypothetical protein